MAIQTYLRTFIHCRLAPDRTAEPVSRHQILRRERGQGNNNFPYSFSLCSADHEKDWQPYSVDPYSAKSDDHRYIDAYGTVRNLVASRSAVVGFCIAGLGDRDDSGSASRGRIMRGFAGVLKTHFSAPPTKVKGVLWNKIMELYQHIKANKNIRDL